jgi:hypothetical protein
MKLLSLMRYNTVFPEGREPNVSSHWDLFYYLVTKIRNSMQHPNSSNKIASTGNLHHQPHPYPLQNDTFEGMASSLELLPDAACIVNRFGCVLASNIRCRRIFTTRLGDNILKNISSGEQDRFMDGLNQPKSSLVIVKQCLSRNDESAFEIPYDWSFGSYNNEFILVTAKLSKLQHTHDLSAGEDSGLHVLEIDRLIRLSDMLMERQWATLKNITKRNAEADNDDELICSELTAMTHASEEMQAILINSQTKLSSRNIK